MARVLNVEWTGQNQTTALAAEQDGGNKMKKYEFTGEVKRIKLIGTEVVLRRIRAVTAFGVVKAGDIGGWIEKEENLSHDGSAWVYGDAEAYSVNHIFSIGPIGSRNEYTTFYRNKNEKIEVRCGCFNGIIEEFLEKVAETHGENKHASVYRAAAEIAKLQIEPLSTDEEAE